MCCFLNGKGTGVNGKGMVGGELGKCDVLLKKNNWVACHFFVI